MSLHRQIADDLGRKISGQLQEVLQREVNIASVVLPHDEIVMMLMQIAAGVHVGAVLAALQARQKTAEPAETFDLFSGLIQELVPVLKPVALSALSDIEANRAREHR